MAASESPEGFKQTPPKPSWLRRISRIFLHWITGILAIFAAGVVLTWFVQVRPQIERTRQLEADLEHANAVIAFLEDEVQRLEGEIMLEIHVVVEQNLQLLGLELHEIILTVIVDVSTAQLALMNNQVEEARAELAGTDSKLAELEGLLDDPEAEQVMMMRDRLALILGELDKDKVAAQSDLEILCVNLLELNETLFGD